MESYSSTLIINYEPEESINNNLKNTTKNGILLNLSRKTKKVWGHHTPETELLQKEDFILFNQMNYSFVLDNGIPVRKLNGLVPYERFVKLFFAEYLKLKIEYCPVGIRVFFADQPINYVCIGYLLNSICDALTTNKFKDYNNFTDHKGFSENLLLNILQNNIYQHKNQSFFIVYLLLLLKNPVTSFIVRNNFYTESGYYYGNPFNSLNKITNLLRTGTKAYTIYRDSLPVIKEYLATVISSSSLNSATKSRMKRNSSGLVTKLTRGF